MYPCPCRYYGDPVKPCTCSSGTVTKYRKRISGPLLDRIDIHIEVPRVEYEKLSDGRLGEPSAREFVCQVSLIHGSHRLCRLRAKNSPLVGKPSRHAMGFGQPIPAQVGQQSPSS